MILSGVADLGHSRAFLWAIGHFGTAFYYIWSAVKSEVCHDVIATRKNEFLEICDFGVRDADGKCIY